MDDVVRERLHYKRPWHDFVGTSLLNNATKNAPLKGLYSGLTLIAAYTTFRNLTIAQVLLT